MKLHPDECYHITWYMSWSPCVKCAKQVANFLARYRNVKLSIFAARLYYFQDMAYRQGLLGLSQQGARVDIMSYRGESRGAWGAGRGEGWGAGEGSLGSGEEGPGHRERVSRGQAQL